MNAPAPVVVGVDGARGHLAIIDLATTEALNRRAPLLIVHAWPGRYSGPLQARGTYPTAADGRHLLEAAAHHAQHLAPALTVRTELTDAAPAQALAERSSAARLLVIGRRDAVFTRPAWGSTASHLARHAACPLLVHRGSIPHRGPVVLAVSAQEPTTATVASAWEEAALSHSRLVAVHVRSGERPDAERHLSEALAGWTSTYPDVGVDRLVLAEPDVAYTLPRASRRGRLLVAGMGRERRFAEILTRWPGAGFPRQSECPVLLVPVGWRHPTMAGVPGGGRHPSMAALAGG